MGGTFVAFEACSPAGSRALPYGYWRTFSEPGLHLVRGPDPDALSGLWRAAAGVIAPAAGAIVYGGFVPWADPEPARAAFLAANVACLRARDHARMLKRPGAVIARGFLALAFPSPKKRAAAVKGLFSPPLDPTPRKAALGALPDAARHAFLANLLLAKKPAAVVLDLTGWDEACGRPGDAAAFASVLDGILRSRPRTVAVAFCADAWAEAFPGSAPLPAPGDPIPPDAVYTLPEPGPKVRVRGQAARFFAGIGAMGALCPARLAAWLLGSVLLFCLFSFWGGLDYGVLPGTAGTAAGRALAVAAPIAAFLGFWLLAWRAAPRGPDVRAAFASLLAAGATRAGCAAALAAHALLGTLLGMGAAAAAAFLAQAATAGAVAVYASGWLWTAVAHVGACAAAFAVFAFRGEGALGGRGSLV